MSSRFQYQFPFPQYPAVRLFLLLAGGILLADIWQLSVLWAGIVVLVSAAITVSTHQWYQGSLVTTHYRLTLVLYMATIVSFGWFWAQFHQPKENKQAAAINRLYKWKSLELSGRIEHLKPGNSENIIIDISADTLWVDGVPILPDQMNIRTYLDSTSDATQYPLKPGNYLSGSVTVYPLEEKRNPHDFDYKAYLTSKRITTHAGIDSVYRIIPEHGISWYSARNYVRGLISQNFTKSTQSLAWALLLGDKSTLTPDIHTQFSRSGLSHIMAVSGLHVGFIVAPFWIVIPFFWRFKWGKITGLTMLVLILYGYAGITGFSASVVRASLMAVLLAYAKLWHRASESLNLMGVAALILLLFDPLQLYEVGFQLSFAAVAVILLLWPVLQNTMPLWVRYRWYGQPISIMAISALVQLGLYPILVYYFGEFSLIGPLVNAVVIPFLGLAVPVAIAALGVTAISPVVGAFINQPVAWFIEILKWITEMASSLPGSWVQVHVETSWIFILWILGIGFLASLYTWQLRWKWLIGLLAVLTFYSGTSLVNKFAVKPMRVVFFDVGQGDAALIETPGGSNFLIDAGVWRPNYSSGESTIVPHLRAEGITRLDAIFLSHPHADHIGGIEAVMEQVPVDTIYTAGTTYDSDLYHRYREKAGKHDIPIMPGSAGDYFRFDEVLVHIYAPTPNISTDNVNEASMVMEIIHGDNEFLFVGDAEKQQENRLVHNYEPLLDTDVLKVPHHGSKTSSTAMLVSASSPQWSVVSVGWNNRYNHPHAEAVRRIRATADSTLFTSREGAIILESNGRKIRRIHWQ